MKQLLFLSLILPIAMMVIACGEKTKENPEADSLRSVLNSRLAEINEMDLFIDAVNASMDSVLKLDGSILRGVSEKNVSRKEQILQNISAYKEILQRQRERLAELEKKQKANGNQNEKLLQTIALLNAQLEEKDKAIAELSEELEKRDFDINTLKARIEKMNAQMADIVEESKGKDEALIAQSDMLNEAYVCIASKKELKDAGILSGGSFLKKSKLNMNEVNTDAFTKIDIRKQKTFSIPSKKPVILTPAPARSYTITNNSDGTSMLTITDPALFWSMSKYLVIRF